jgi:hypothetical protein
MNRAARLARTCRECGRYVSRLDDLVDGWCQTCVPDCGTCDDGMCLSDTCGLCGTTHCSDCDPCEGDPDYYDEVGE